MKFTDDELLDLTLPDGGRFHVADESAGFAFCRRLALGHYENFPVGSMLIPANLRPHFFSIYAFSRIADDLGDELGALGVTAQLDALKRFENLLENGVNAGNPVFTALHVTRRQFDIPALPFQKLITAFRRDVQFTQPETFADILDYCTYSANPVGELVLRLAGVYNSRTARLSDDICTALQLVNFWQDISRDFAQNRMYLPRNMVGDVVYAKHYLHTTDFYTKFSVALPRLIAETAVMFARGAELLQYMPQKRLRWEIAATVASGKRILYKVERLGAKVLTTRPSLTIADGAAIVFTMFSKGY